MLATFLKGASAAQQKYLVDASAQFSAVNGASSVNVTFSNVSAGDLLYVVARVGSTSGLSWVTPSGWTRVNGQTNTLGVTFFRTVTEGGTSVNITGWSVSSTGVAACGLHYKNVSVSDRQFLDSAAATTHAFPSVDMSSEGQLTCIAIATVNAPTISTPSGMTQYFSETTTTLGSRTIAVFVEDVGSGDTGTRTTTRNPSGTLYLASLGHV